MGPSTKGRGGVESVEQQPHRRGDPPDRWVHLRAQLGGWRDGTELQEVVPLVVGEPEWALGDRGEHRVGSGSCRGPARAARGSRCSPRRGRRPPPGAGLGCGADRSPAARLAGRQALAAGTEELSEGVRLGHAHQHAGTGADEPGLRVPGSARSASSWRLGARSGTTPTSTSTTTLAGRRPLGALDVAHSSVSFAVRHLGVSKVRGRFTDFTADVVVGDDLASTSVAAVVHWPRSTRRKRRPRRPPPGR